MALIRDWLARSRARREQQEEVERQQVSRRVADDVQPFLRADERVTTVARATGAYVVVTDRRLVVLRPASRRRAMSVKQAVLYTSIVGRPTYSRRNRFGNPPTEFARIDIVAVDREHDPTPWNPRREKVSLTFEEPWLETAREIFDAILSET